MRSTNLSPGWRRRLVLVALALLTSALTGCFMAGDPDEDCDEPAEYQASRSVPGIAVPAGLAPPKEASAYVVPGPAAQAPPKAACLARPPDFFRKEPAPAAQ